MTPLPVQVHIHVPIWLAVGIFLVALGRAIWVVYREQAILDQLDQATDDADRACRGLDEVKDYLFGLEPPATGRHAHRSEAGARTVMARARPEAGCDGLSTVRAGWTTPHTETTAQRGLQGDDG